MSKGGGKDASPVAAVSHEVEVLSLSTPASTEEKNAPGDAQVARQLELDKKTAEKRLEAAMKQLEAAKQTLEAAEKRLKAAEKRLKAAEKRLKARLKAAEKRLKAAEKRLKAAENDLVDNEVKAITLESAVKRQRQALEQAGKETKDQLLQLSESEDQLRIHQLLTSKKKAEVDECKQEVVKCKQEVVECKQEVVECKQEVVECKQEVLECKHKVDNWDHCLLQCLNVDDAKGKGDNGVVRAKVNKDMQAQWADAHSEFVKTKASIQGTEDLEKRVEAAKKAMLKSVTDAGAQVFFRNAFDARCVEEIFGQTSKVTQEMFEGFVVKALNLSPQQLRALRSPPKTWTDIEKACELAWNCFSQKSEADPSLPEETLIRQAMDALPSADDTDANKMLIRWLCVQYCRLRHIPAPPTNRPELTYDYVYLSGIMDLLTYDQPSFELLYREAKLSSTQVVRDVDRRSDLYAPNQRFIYESSLSKTRSQPHFFGDAVKILNALICARKDKTQANSPADVSVGLQFGRITGSPELMVVTLLHPVGNTMAYWSKHVHLPSSRTGDDVRKYLRLCLEVGVFVRTYVLAAPQDDDEVKEAGDQPIPAASGSSVPPATPSRTTQGGQSQSSIATEVMGTYTTPAKKCAATAAEALRLLPAPIPGHLATMLRARSLRQLAAEFFHPFMPDVSFSDRNEVYMGELLSAPDQAVIVKLCRTTGDATEVKALLRLQGTVGVVQAKHVLCVDDGNGEANWGVVMPKLAEVEWNEVTANQEVFHRFLEGVVEALGSCHARNVAHGDMKPSAVHQLNGVPTLIDFDLALPAGDDMGDELHGTPGYVFPDSPCRTGASMDCVALGNFIGRVLYRDNEAFGSYRKRWDSHFDAQRRAHQLASKKTSASRKRPWRRLYMQLAYSLMAKSDQSLMRTWTLWECQVYLPARSNWASPAAVNTVLAPRGKKTVGAGAPVTDENIDPQQAAYLKAPLAGSETLKGGKPLVYRG